MAPPADLDDRLAASPAELPCDDPGSDLLAMLRDDSWVYTQYDHQLFLNTVVGPGADATLLRLKHPTTMAETGRGLALTTDGNHRWCATDPKVGTKMVMAESVMNLACVGARPSAVVNCLNFGNPEHPEIMWQLSGSIDGLAEACVALGLPVVGGNVSLYNESQGSNIDPTPVVGVLGLVDDLETVPPGMDFDEGDRLMVLGEPSSDLVGSLWADNQGFVGGTLPEPNFAAISAVAKLSALLVNRSLVTAIHDVAEGGLGTALAEMAIASQVGCHLARISTHAELFSEAPGRMVVAVDPEDMATVESLAAGAGVPVTRIGLATGDKLVAKGLLDLPLAQVDESWRSVLPDALGSGTTEG